MSDVPQSWQVGRSDISPCDNEGLDRDPRGILWMWEQPNKRFTYVLGCDPTQGITGWHRSLRTRDDAKTDNGAIVVVRKGDGTPKHPDVQVAEYAAPVDPYELAVVTNIIGRIYGGDSEDEQAMATIEVYPGPGWATLKEMRDKYGYTNFYVWMRDNGLRMERTRQVGWLSNKHTNRDLFVWCLRHIGMKGFEPRSPWLVEEFADAVADLDLAKIRATYGHHDDRMRAAFLAIFTAHEMENPTAANSQGAEELNKPDWQRSGVTLEQMMEEASDRFAELSED